MFSQAKTDAKNRATLCAYTLSLTSAVAFSSSPAKFLFVSKISTWKMLDVACHPFLSIIIWIIEQGGIWEGVHGQPKKNPGYAPLCGRFYGYVKSKR